MLFYAQTEKTDEFRDLVIDLVKRRPMLSGKTFEILRRQNLARSLRLQDSFQGLAQKELEAVLDDVPLAELTEMARNITLTDVEQAVRELNFENCTVTLITPQNEALQG